jgi:hypothetical protein
MAQQTFEFGAEGRIGLGGPVFALKVQDQWHQRFGDIAAAEFPEVTARVRLRTKRV